jgi:glycerol uptake facilitator-like aquaporin
VKHLGKVQALLAFVLTVGFFACIWMVTKTEVSSSMRDAMLILIGSLGAAFGAVVNYYFGSSSGSAQKNQLLAEKSQE